MEFYSIDPKPKFIETILYSYFYVGILTGPYFKYRTYRDWLQLSAKESSRVDSFKFIFQRGKAAPLIVIGFLILSKFVSFKVKFNLTTN